MSPRLALPALPALFLACVLGLTSVGSTVSAAPAATPNPVPVTHALPRPPDGLLDTTGRVSREATAAFRRVAEHVRRETGGEIAAAVVDSLDGKEPGEYARELSESWRLGGDEARGALILVALGDRQIQLTLGRGLDDPERREHAAEIVRETLAPRLRQGDVGGAIAAAARECATRIFYAVEVVDPGLEANDGGRPAEGEGTEAGETGSASPSPSPSARPPAHLTSRHWSWAPYAIGLAVLLLGLALYGAFRSERR